MNDFSQKQVNVSAYSLIFSNDVAVVKNFTYNFMLQSLKQYYAIMHQLKTCITIYEWKLILPWLIVPLGSCACSLCTVCSRKENNVKMAEEAKDFAKWMYSFFSQIKTRISL